MPYTPEAITKDALFEPKIGQDELLTILSREKIVQPASARVVDNEVVLVNNKVKMENIDMVQGTSTPLGVQLALGESKKTPDRIVYMRVSHTRSTLISSDNPVEFYGVKYRYIDAKGTGNISHVLRHNIERANDEMYLLSLKPVPDKDTIDSEGAPTTWGGVSLYSEEYVAKEMQIANELAEHGIRTVPMISAVKLNEVLDAEGNKISIERAKELGYVHMEDIPALYFRAWVTPHRMKDAYYPYQQDENFDIITTNKDRTRLKKIVLAAMVDIQHDDSIPQEVRERIKNPSEYVKWLATEVGLQVGKLHNMGKVHGYLEALHNITLDARLVDVDSVQGKKELGENLESEIKEEGNTFFAGKADALGTFFKGIVKLLDIEDDPEVLKQMCFRSYQNIRNSK